MKSNKCIGYNSNGQEFECGKSIDPRSYNWCRECEERRRDKIDIQIEKLRFKAIKSGCIDFNEFLDTYTL